MPKSSLVRPTREMVRKAIFDVLMDFVEGKDVLDLFSGSGALGFQALSNGARSVTFVETQRVCCGVIRENAAALGVESRCRILCRDVFAVLPWFKQQSQTFPLIFSDPPYGRDLAKKCLLEICGYDIVLPPAIVVIEHSKTDEMPSECSPLTLWQNKKYGDTFVSFYTNM